MCDFAVDEVPLGQAFLPVLRFSSVRIFIVIDMLLLPEGQTNEAWEPSKKQFCFGIQTAWNRKVISISVRHQGHALA
jgi:hypothetical protein